MADATLGAAVLRTSLDASGLKAGLAQARGETDRAVRDITQRLDSIGQGMQTLGRRMSLFITAPLTAIGAVGVKSAMQLETFAASLNVLIGDAERANRVFDELYEFSANTPFDWRTLTEGTRVLAAFGTEAEDIVPTLSRLGDIASGTQSDLASLAEIYGRVLVTGRMSMDEVNQLAARGVPIYTELASVLGVSTDQVRELVSQGKIGFPELETVIRNLTSEGGKFFGMMDAQADTVAGRLARLKDSFEQVTDIVGERLLPVFDRLVNFGQRATDWFVNLDESTQQWIIGLGAGLAASGPILVGVGTLVVQIPKVVAGFQALRTAMLPLLGPAGVIALLAVGLYAVWTAMDVGRRSREEMGRQFDALIGKMQSYRQQLVITSEAEREAAIQSLERQRVALGNILNVTRSRLQQELAFVREYEQKSFLGQIVSGDSLAADAAMRSARELERQVAELERQIAAVDQQLAQVRTLTITPVVEPPPPGSFDIPEDGSTVTVTVNVEVNDPAEEARRWVARLEAELRFGLKGPSEVIDLLSPRVEELREEAAAALAEFGIDSEAYQDTVAKLDVIEGALQRLQNLSRLQVPVDASGIVGLSDEPVVMTDERRQEAAALLEQVERTARLTELEADRQRIAENRRIAMEIMADTEQAMADAAERERQARLDGYREELERIAETRRQAMAIVADTRQAMAERRAELQAFNQRLGDLSLQLGARTSRGDGGLSILQAGRRSIDDVDQELSAARAAVRAAATDEARHEAQLVVMELERELERLQRQITPRELVFEEGIEPTVTLNGPLRLNLDAGKVDGVTLFGAAGRGSGGRFGEANIVRQEDADRLREAAEAQRQAGFDFAETVINAGQGFVGAIEAFQAGNIGGGIAGLGGAVGGLFSGLGQLGGAFAGLSPWGAIISAGAGLLGGLVNLFGGGGQSERERAQREARRVGNVPAINLTFQVTQTNNYQGGPSQPENEQAFRRQANVLWEELYRRHLGPRFDRIEQRLGIAGAGA